MKEKDSKNIIIILLVIIIVILTILVVLLSTNNITFNGENTQLNNENVVEENEDEVIDETEEVNVISQGELEDIVDRQLYILNGKTSISEITNQQKLSLALSYINNNSIGYSDVDKVKSFTSDELLDAFNNTCISNLGIIHEKIRAVKSVTLDGNLGYGYSYADGVYTFSGTTNSGVSEVNIYGKKVTNFSNNGNRYTISYKYMWSDLDEASLCNNVYGKYSDVINGQNSLGQLQNTNSICDDDAFVERNFDNYSAKLEQYNYVFEKEDGKVMLVDFYVN